MSDSGPLAGSERAGMSDSRPAGAQRPWPYFEGVDGLDDHGIHWLAHQGSRLVAADEVIVGRDGRITVLVAGR